ncbi:gp48-like protein [Phenacoccus solenopsis nudivirus]|nr:gp48-like protein [Phenacoccus solenopsis nudivirus]
MPKKLPLEIMDSLLNEKLEQLQRECEQGVAYSNDYFAKIGKRKRKIESSPLSSYDDSTTNVTACKKRKPSSQHQEQNTALRVSKTEYGELYSRLVNDVDNRYSVTEENDHYEQFRQLRRRRLDREAQRYSKENEDVLTLERVMAMFEYYEPSKFLVWEICRTFNPLALYTFLFVLNNVIKDTKSDTFSSSFCTDNNSNTYNDDKIHDIDNASSRKCDRRNHHHRRRCSVDVDDIVASSRTVSNVNVATIRPTNTAYVDFHHSFDELNIRKNDQQHHSHRRRCQLPSTSSTNNDDYDFDDKEYDSDYYYENDNVKDTCIRKDNNNDDDNDDYLVDFDCRPVICLRQNIRDYLFLNRDTADKVFRNFKTTSHLGDSLTMNGLIALIQEYEHRVAKERIKLASTRTNYRNSLATHINSVRNGGSRRQNRNINSLPKMRNKLIYNSVFDKCSTLDRVVIHNMRTMQYLRFLKNVEHYLFPEQLHVSRNNTRITERLDNDIPARFLQFYRLMLNAQEGTGDELNYSIYSTQSVIRSIVKPRPRPIDVDPLALNPTNEYYIQPYYIGVYCIVHNSARADCKFYNRYGELITNVPLMRQSKLDIDVTYEAVMMPLNRQMCKLDSWRSRNPFTYKDLVMVIVDVVYIHGEHLMRKSFKERYANIDQILESYRRIYGQCSVCRLTNGNQVRFVDDVDSNTSVWFAASEQYHSPHDNESLQRLRTSFEQTPTDEGYTSIGGLVYRCENNASLESPLYKRFETRDSLVYAFLQNEKTTLYGEACPLIPLNLTYSLECCRYTTICAIYAHDDRYLYACRFNRSTLRIEHYGRFRILHQNTNQLKYQLPQTYVHNSRLNPMGIMLIRVYHNNNGLFVGYEIKVGTSVYDLPLVSVERFVELYDPEP